MITSASRSIARLKFVWLTLALAPIGCAADRRPSRETPTASCVCEDKLALNPRLMHVLSMAQAYHHQADIYLQAGAIDNAIDAVRKVLDLELAPQFAEAEDVRLDATARLAKLLLGREREAEALTLVDRALPSATRESFYVASLHSVRGEILQHRSQAEAKAGQAALAKATAREAIAAFEQSIVINKRLQKALLPEKNP